MNDNTETTQGKPSPSLIYQRFEIWRKQNSKLENLPNQESNSKENTQLPNDKLQSLQITTQTDRHEPSNAPPIGEKLLYVDILNYSEAFFQPHSRWNIKRSYENVKKFVAAVRKSNYKLKLFIDDSIATNEAIKKWRKRREKEVNKGEKRIPQGTSILLGDMFQRCSIPVVYSLEADNDDTLAFHAHEDGADILSNDGDFFRYKGAAYKVWADFDRNELRRGNFRLIPHTNEKVSKSQMISKRILGQPPRTRKAYSNVDDFKNKLSKDYTYISGVPSPLIRATGINPHITISPLRHALFSSIFNEGIVIKEEFPNWNETNKCCEWYVNEVNINTNTKNKYYIELLENPLQAFFEIFPNEANNVKPSNLRCDGKDWHNHRFACCCIVSQICCIFTGKELLGTMMKMVE